MYYLQVLFPKHYVYGLCMAVVLLLIYTAIEYFFVGKSHVDG